MSGPPPKPTRLKILQGTVRKDRLNTAEPVPAAGRPLCPSWLALEAKREWRRIVPKLDAMGVLTSVDGAALAGYCQSYANWRKAEEFLANNSYSVALTRTDRDGNDVVYAWQQRPEVTISQKERQIMKMFLTEFGLTPASRTRIKAEKPAEIDPLDKYFNGTG